LLHGFQSVLPPKGRGTDYMAALLLLKACLVSSSVLAEHVDLEGVLAGDDQCSDAEECALNALQRRGQKVASESAEAVDQAQDCFDLGTYYTEPSGQHVMDGTRRSLASTPAECQSRCASTDGCAHFSYWSDGGCLLTSAAAYPRKHHGSIAGPASCGGDAGEVDTSPPSPPAPIEIDPTLQSSLGAPPMKIMTDNSHQCAGLHETYKLAWEASGDTFFDKWLFMTEDETHGAVDYLSKEDAFKHGVIKTHPSHVNIGVGAKTQPLKRASVMLHSKQAWRPDAGFIVAMQYNHVPYGAGVWPAFWLMNSDVLWPHGGELDIMEYANDEVSKVTFHTGQNCMLNGRRLGQCFGRHKDGMKGPGPSNCNTNYFKNLLGCRPRQVQRSGEWYAKNPGVMAAVWDASGVSVYHIPKAEIPADLASDKPKPEGWGRWRTAYIPFDERTCFDAAKPQEIVLNIALCGDWAGGAWARSPAARRTGFMSPRCRPGALSTPSRDCCTQFVDSPGSESYFRSRAYFDIESIKVFEPEGEDLPKLGSGTYRRGGVALKS